MTSFRFLIPSTVLLIAALRLSSLWSSPVQVPEDIRQEDIQSILHADPLRSRIGEFRIEYQRFDRNAAIVVTPGTDGMPGVAGTDDNMNGVVDDRLELGATRSDDVCSVLTPAQLEQFPADQIMVLQTGALVTCRADPTLYPQRATVFGGKDGSPWTVKLDIPQAFTSQRIRNQAQKDIIP